MQKEHEGIFECHVNHTNPEENGAVRETVSRIRLCKSRSMPTVPNRRSLMTASDVHDCDQEGESSDFRNLMNPCKHGICGVENKTSVTNAQCQFEYLVCDCVEEQYTGEFCEGKGSERCTDFNKSCLVEISGTTWRELIFWSPIFFYFIAVGILCVVALCLEKRRYALNGRSNSHLGVTLQQSSAHFSSRPRSRGPTASTAALSSGHRSGSHFGRSAARRTVEATDRRTR